MAIPNPAINRLHYFDGLRAIACLLILIHHTATGAIVKIFQHYGYPALAGYFSNFTQSGVEIFFLLSGILLLRPYFKGERTFSAKKYYKRRLSRIYIPYFFAVVFGGLVIWINTSFPTWYSSILIKFTWDGFLKQFLLFNWYGGYYNLAWWSLQIEVIFYLLIPFILHAAYKARFWPCLIGIIVVSVILQLTLNNYLPQYYSIDRVLLNPFKIVDYLPTFLMGIFLSKDSFENRTAYFFIIAGLLVELASIYYSPAIHLGLSFIYFGIFILIFNISRLQDILSKPILVWIGERSYSLFLVHFSVLYLTNYLISYFVEDRSLVYGILSRSLGWLFSFFISMLLFHFVERKQAKGLQTAEQFWPPIFEKKQ